MVVFLLSTMCTSANVWRTFKNTVFQVKETLTPKVAADITANAQQTIEKTTGEIHQIVHEAKDALGHIEVVVEPKVEGLERILEKPIVVQHDVTGFNKQAFDHVCKKITLNLVSLLLAGSGTGLLYKSIQAFTPRHLVAGGVLLAMGIEFIYDDECVTKLKKQLARLGSLFKSKQVSA